MLPRISRDWGDEPGTLINLDGGVVDVIHDGNFNLGDIDGEVVHSEKCTEVDFDPITGEWFSELRDGRELCRSMDRKEVVIKEHQIIAEMLIRGQKVPANNWRSTLIRDIRRWFRKHLPAKRL